MNTDVQPEAEVSAGKALLVEPSRLSPTRRALTTVLRSRELSIFLVLVAVDRARDHARTTASSSAPTAGATSC